MRVKKWKLSNILLGTAGRYGVLPELLMGSTTLQKIEEQNTIEIIENLWKICEESSQACR